jgi:hypothetical protein
VPTLFRVLHGPSYRQLRNRVNGTPSFEVVAHHLKRLMVDWNFGIRIGSGSERRDRAADWRVTREKATACANSAPDGFPRGVGAQFLRKTAVFYQGRAAEVAWRTRRIPSLFIKLRSVLG